jgi:hypothetical protein
VLKPNIVLDHVTVTYCYAGITSWLVNMWQFPYPYGLCNLVWIYGKKINDLIWSMIYDMIQYMIYDDMIYDDMTWYMIYNRIYDIIWYDLILYDIWFDTKLKYRSSATSSVQYTARLRTEQWLHKIKYANKNLKNVEVIQLFPIQVHACTDTHTS